MQLWEILVPASNWHTNTSFSYEHHKQWDDYVVSLTGGLTVFRGAKGSWRAPDGQLHLDRVIPCRIACWPEQLDKILLFTGSHYQQLAVMAYQISNNVIIKDTSHLIKNAKN